MNLSSLICLLVSLSLLQVAADGQRLLRENRVEEARIVFDQILAKTPKNVDAMVGAGFTALRQERVLDALNHFQNARDLAPKYTDATLGLAICYERLGKIPEARRYATEAIKLDPRREDSKAVFARLFPITAPPPPPRPSELQLPFRATPEGFQIRKGSQWQTIYLKGVNLGAALPGRFPTQFPGIEVYRGWLKEIGDMGINVVRVYTIHPPCFYEALREHNLKATNPIYLIHGVWVEPPPNDEFGDKAWFDAWRQDMSHMVDLIHGRASFPPKPGFTGGNYRANVSPWWIGTILGREWEPFNVMRHIHRYPGLADWKGRFVEISQGHATEVFMAKTLDAFIALEHDTYNTQRPVAFTNWPTLDPLVHPTETPFLEEQQLKKKLGMPYSDTKMEVYDDDSVSIDMEKYTALNTFQGGLFISYHIYPNFPEFINLDPGYSKAVDYEGTNNYFGYLKDLRAYHKKYPILVSEFGISTSRITAHWQPQGMNHGGLNEKAQAAMMKRLIRNIYDAGYAGSIVFAFMDEWFKKTWQVSPIELPADRKLLWFNSMDVEESYGIIGHHPGAAGPNILIDGRPEDWKDIPIYQKNEDLELKLFADEGWLHIGLFWKRTKPDWNKEKFLLGLDTYDSALGNHHFPFSVPMRSETGMEFVIELSGNNCGVWVDEPYEYSPHRKNRPVRTINHEDGPWRQMETETNRLRVGRDSTIYKARRYEVGVLRKGTQDRSDPAFDSLGEWMEGKGFIEARIPWTLIHVTDPSSHHVLQDPLSPQREDPYGTAITDGFRASLLLIRQEQSLRTVVLGSIPATHNGELTKPPLFTWANWEEPKWHAYRKLSFKAVRDAFLALPYEPKSNPSLVPPHGP